MATINKAGSAVAIPVDGLNRHYILKNEIDFAEDKLSATQTVAVFNIPANTIVREVLLKVVRADTGCDDFDVGIEGANTDGFHDGSNLGATGWVRDISGEPYSPPTGFLASANSVLIAGSPTDAVQVGKVQFFAECIDLNYNRVV